MGKRLGSFVIALIAIMGLYASCALASAKNLDYNYASPAIQGDEAFYAGTQPLQASGPLMFTQWTELIDSDGNWGARGQVKNTSNSRLWYTKVKVDLLDKSSGRFVKNEFAYVNGETARTVYDTVDDSTIAPGSTVTFDITYTDVKASDVRAGSKSFAYYTYSSEALRANLMVTELTEYSYRGEWAGRGIVKNSGWDWSYFTKVRADCFDSFNNYIGGDYAYVNGQTATTKFGTTTDTAVASGASASFDIKWTGIPWADVDHVRTKVRWTEN